MATKKKSARKAAVKGDVLPNPVMPSEMQSVAASEQAAEGRTSRKNPDLPGMVGDGVAKPQIPALDDAVTEYVKERDKRMEHGIKEKTLKKQVVALMMGHKLGSYEVDDMVVVVKHKDETETIKVVAKADYTGVPTPGDDGDDE